MVTSSPSSDLCGRAKSIVCPFRKSPRESSWLFMYRDAVRRLSASMFAGSNYNYQVRALRNTRRCIRGIHGPTNVEINGFKVLRRMNLLCCHVNKQIEIAGVHRAWVRTRLSRDHVGVVCDDKIDSSNCHCN